MKRRAFIAGLGSVAAWPVMAQAQRASMPVVAFISPADPVGEAHIFASFRQGLSQTGYGDGTNVTIESLWLEGKFDRLPEVVADLVNRPVNVIVSTTPGALAAKKITSTIPIVFATGGDPIKLGLVPSFNRPGANLSGVTFLAPLMESKRLSLLQQMTPEAKTIAVLINPRGPLASAQSNEVPEAASTLNLHLQIRYASEDRDLDAAFVDFAHLSCNALLVVSDPFFNAKREKIIALATRQTLPAIYEWREFAYAGGLMSYGTSITDAFRQVGVYTGQILNGAKPADLPVLQATKFEFVINLKAAKALDLTVPPTLLARADEVIE